MMDTGTSGAGDFDVRQALARYEIRAATLADQGDLWELARYLDTVNLPRDQEGLRAILRCSEASFRGEISDVRHRSYVFVLRDRSIGAAIGTSTVIGQLGQRDAPYIYYGVRTEERYSATLDRHFEHLVLGIGYAYAGPTEIGGLVLHPDHRRSPLRLGRLISFVRFLWIAMHRAQFQEQVLAELLPPLEEDGTSHLWEAVGRRFTGLTYREADRLSQHNKEFIRSLFPEGDIYVSLLPPEAQAVVGQVGAQTRGVEKMLRGIGFRYADRIDPFDGGPHFVADTKTIRPVRETRLLRLQSGSPAASRLWLVGCETPDHPYFEARLVRGQAQDDRLLLVDEDAQRLDAAQGWCLPFASNL